MARPLGPDGIAAGHIALAAEVAAIVRDLAAKEGRTYNATVVRAIKHYAALVAVNSAR